MDNATNKNDEPQEPGRVSKETVDLAVKLLLKMISSKRSLISLVVSLKSRSDSTAMIPRTSQYIPVPHPLYSIDGSQEICLIIGNKKKGLNAELAENKIKEEGLPISKVFQLSTLTADYRKCKGSKKPSQSFDLFMVCKSLFSKVSGFYWSIRNHMIPVDLTHERWKGQMELACSLTSISICHSSRVVKVGRVSQASKEIVENIIAVIDRLVSEIPEKWNNISSMHLQSSGPLQCPLYQSFPVPETDEPGMNGKGGITGGISGKKRTKHAEKTLDAKRKKGLASEGKAGSFNGLAVGDGVPKDEPPAASGLEKENESVDSQGGVVANSVEVTGGHSKEEKIEQIEKKLC